MINLDDVVWENMYKCNRCDEYSDTGSDPKMDLIQCGYCGHTQVSEMEECQYCSSLDAMSLLIPGDELCLHCKEGHLHFVQVTECPECGAMIDSDNVEMHVTVYHND